MVACVDEGNSMLAIPETYSKTRMVARLLKRDEMSLYLDHLLHLDEKSREQRFDHAMHDEAIKAHCRGLKKFRTRIVGAFVDDALRGACEISQPIYNKRPIRELAFSVERPFKGLGLGSALMVRSLRLIKPAPVIMYCQISNLAMIALAQKFGARISIERDCVICNISNHRVARQKSQCGGSQFGLTNVCDLVTMNPCF